MVSFPLSFLHSRSPHIAARKGDMPPPFGRLPAPSLRQLFPCPTSDPSGQKEKRPFFDLCDFHNACQPSGTDDREVPSSGKAINEQGGGRFGVDKRKIQLIQGCVFGTPTYKKSEIPSLRGFVFWVKLG